MKINRIEKSEENPKQDDQPLRSRKYFKIKPFIDQYLIDFNAVKAYQRAGYSTGNYMSDANRAKELLQRPDVQKVLAEAQADLARRTELKQEEIIAELKKIAFSNIKDYISWEDNSVDIVDSEEIPDEKSAAISEIKQTINANGSATIQIKLYDKKSALIDLGHHIGMFQPDEFNKEDPVETARKIRQALQEMDEVTSPEPEVDEKVNDK